MKQPLRTCVGCLAKRPKNQLSRLVIKNGKLIMDPRGENPGRGAYLCQNKQKINPDCLKIAYEKNAFKKAFREKIKKTCFLASPKKRAGSFVGRQTSDRGGSRSH